MRSHDARARHGGSRTPAARPGCSATEIERRTGVPRRTVTDWIAGRLPQRSLGPKGALCPHIVYVSRKADVALLDEFVGPKA